LDVSTDSVSTFLKFVTEIKAKAVKDASVLPSVKVQGQDMIVTLPNGETVTFDKDIQAIKYGVLKETSKMTAGASWSQRSKPKIRKRCLRTRIRSLSEVGGDGHEVVPEFKKYTTIRRGVSHRLIFSSSNASL